MERKTLQVGECWTAGLQRNWFRGIFNFFLKANILHCSSTGCVRPSQQYQWNFDTKWFVLLQVFLPGAQVQEYWRNVKIRRSTKGGIRTQETAGWPRLPTLRGLPTERAGGRAGTSSPANCTHRHPSMGGGGEERKHACALPIPPPPAAG